MDHKSIPAITLGLISVLAACSDPVIGDWELVDARPDGIRIPISYSGYDDYCGNYTVQGEVQLTARLEIDDDLDATMNSSAHVEYTYNSDDCGSGTYEENYTSNFTGEATKEEKGEYEIELNGEDRLDLTCTLDGDELECEIQGEEPGTLIFERQ